jgi:hypothetical protein
VDPEVAEENSARKKELMQHGTRFKQFMRWTSTVYPT